MYGEEDSDRIEDKNYKPIDGYRCRKCQRVFKCRSSISGFGCPSCDADRGFRSHA